MPTLGVGTIVQDVPSKCWAIVPPPMTAPTIHASPGDTAEMSAGATASARAMGVSDQADPFHRSTNPRAVPDVSVTPPTAQTSFGPSATTRRGSPAVLGPEASCTRVQDDPSQCRTIVRDPWA